MPIEELMKKYGAAFDLNGDENDSDAEAEEAAQTVLSDGQSSSESEYSMIL